MCPIRSFHVKNYRPNWITNELLEQIKDRDYFYSKAKSTGNEDDWNIAKYLRNLNNANIRRAKREFILEELEANADNCKKFWKVIQDVIPSDKKQERQDIPLKDSGAKIVKDKVADLVNNYFINVGNVNLSANNDIDAGEESEVVEEDSCDLVYTEGSNLDEFCKLREVEVLRLIKD